MSCFIIKILSDFHVVGFSQDPKGEVKRENGYFDPEEGHWHDIFISEVIYQPFMLKIRQKVCFLRNNSKPPFKMSRKQVFWPRKWSKWTYHDFERHQKYFWADTKHMHGHFKPKNNAQSILKQLPNNFEKVKFWPNIRPTHPPTK